MSVTYKIDANKRTVRTKCVGSVTLHEIIDHFRILQQDPECPDRLDVFLDLSEMESLPETGQLSTGCRRGEKNQESNPFRCLRYYCQSERSCWHDENVRGDGRGMFGRRLLFVSRDDAEAWLVSQQSLADKEWGGWGEWWPSTRLLRPV
jgi:hypothetical protein